MMTRFFRYARSPAPDQGTGCVPSRDFSHRPCAAGLAPAVRDLSVNMAPLLTALGPALRFAAAPGPCTWPECRPSSTVSAVATRDDPERTAGLPGSPRETAC